MREWAKQNPVLRAPINKAKEEEDNKDKKEESSQIQTLSCFLKFHVCKTKPAHFRLFVHFRPDVIFKLFYDF